MRSRLLSGLLAVGLLAPAAEARGHHFHFGHDGQSRPGPTASELLQLFEAFGRADPLVCGLAVDALLSGAFFNHTPTEDVATLKWKETLSGDVTAPDALALLASRLKDAVPCVRRLSAEVLGTPE